LYPRGKLYTRDEKKLALASSEEGERVKWVGQPEGKEGDKRPTSRGVLLVPYWRGNRRGRERKKASVTIAERNSAEAGREKGEASL